MGTFFVVLCSLVLIVVFKSRLHVPENKAALIRWETPQIPFIRDILGRLGLPINPIGGNDIVALSGQTGGWSAIHWASGDYWIPLVGFRFLAKVRTFDPMEVKENQVGLMTAKVGKNRPQGQNYPTPLDDLDFSNGEDFIRRDGQRGLQLQTLGPGKHFCNPEIWEFEPVDRVDIEPAIFPDDPYNRGKPTDEAWPRLGLADLRIGRIIPEDERTKRTLAVVVPGHENFANLVAFIQNGGEQGTQIEVLEPGSSRINTGYVGIEMIFATRVRPGWTIVLISSQGDEPDENDFIPVAELGGRRPVHVLKKGIVGKRGTLADTLGPRDWFINPRRYKRILVNTSPQTLAWDKTQYDEKDKPLRQFPPLDVESKEGFKFNVVGALVFEVKDQDAPMMTRAAGGEIEKLVKAIGPMVGQVVHRICRQHPMIDFVRDTKKGLAAELTKALKAVLSFYYITVHGFEIVDLDYESRGDKNLAEFLKQLAEQEIAAQRELANKAGIPAEVARIELEEKRGEADAQKVIKVGKAEAEAKTLVGNAEAEIMAKKGAAVVALLPSAGLSKDVGQIIVAGITALSSALQDSKKT
ncbi:MAG: SPFH domain-containing protein [Patescibacteria group bacterium]